jgi:hypothetical protein
MSESDAARAFGLMSSLRHALNRLRAQAEKEVVRRYLVGMPASRMFALTEGLAIVSTGPRNLHGRRARKRAEPSARPDPRPGGVAST